MDERPVRLEVNGWTLASWTASPDHADALGAGRLLVDGLIDGRADLHALEVEETPTGTIVRARVDPARVAAARAGASSADAEDARTRTDPPDARAANATPHAGTGTADTAGSSTAGDMGALPPELRARLAGHPRADRPRAPLPPLAAFGPLFRDLFQSAELYQETGGLHAAALSDGRDLRHRVEEVGRHNAVDKAVGLAVLAGDDLSRLGLVISARISGEMALKAARAGLAWVASRSVPTTLAVAVAETAGLPIVARAAGKEPYVYAAPGASPPHFYPGSPLASAPPDDAEPSVPESGSWGQMGGPGSSEHGPSGGYDQRGGPESGDHGPSGGYDQRGGLESGGQGPDGGYDRRAGPESGGHGPAGDSERSDPTEDSDA